MRFSMIEILAGIGGALILGFTFGMFVSHVAHDHGSALCAEMMK
jgi:hypothetical protein